jgi:hypothetical protein
MIHDRRRASTALLQNFLSWDYAVDQVSAASHPARSSVQFRASAARSSRTHQPMIFAPESS